MHPRSRPIHRSRLLWLALPGLIFLLWAWLNPPASYLDLNFTLGDHTLRLGDHGRVCLLQLHLYRRGLWTAPGLALDYGSSPEAILPEHMQLFPHALHCEKWSDPGLTVFTLSLSYWLLILLYLALITAIHIGWSRRHARLAATSTAAIPAS